jgi:multiple sugar transport system substrate-binding protein
VGNVLRHTFEANILFMTYREERYNVQKSKLAIFVGLASTTLVAAMLTNPTAASAAGSMGPGPKVKAATSAVGALIDYTNQPYAPETYKNAAKVKDGNRDCSYNKISTKDYSGQEIRVLAPGGDNMGQPAAQHGAMFEKLTGGKIKIERVSFGELYSKAQTSFQTGQDAYDITFNLSNWLGDFSDFYYTIPAKYTSGTGELATMLPLYKDIYKWKGETKLFGVDADRHFLKYRTDVYNDTAAQAFFKKKTGKTLAVPTTWTEYNLHAKTFNNYAAKGQPGGVKMSGTVEITNRADLMYAAFIDRVAPYAKNPNVKTGFWFDKNMVPQVNNPGFVRGLTEFVAAGKSMPQGGLNFGLSDEITAFAAGKGLLSYTWDDAWSASNENASVVRGNVYAAPNPGAETVWNSDTKKWETPMGGINRAPYISFGWSSAIPETSNNKQMALDFLCFFGNEANHAIDLTIGSTGVNPSRTEDFTKDFWVKKLGWQPGPTQSWLDTLNIYAKSKNRVFDLRTPGNGPFMQSLADGVALALAGTKSPKAALDAVAKEWVKIVNQNGKKKVQDAYANVIKLENS